MIPQIKEEFTDDILNEALQRYDINPESITLLGGFESFVYQYQKEHSNYILKITHDLRRTTNYIYGEIDWLQHLSKKGLPVLKPVPSTNGVFIEEIPSKGGNFLIISYEKAPGEKVSEQEWDDTLFKAWGSLSGRLHQATKDHQVTTTDYKRQEWTEEEQLNAEKYLPADDPIVRNLKRRIEKLSSLQKTYKNYGLVHADFHQKNFHFYHEEIYLFDFDDCSYTYFANDIAISFYYALMYPFKEFENRTEYYRTFFRSFMEGYLEHNVLTEEEIGLLHDFIKLRHTLNYIIVHQVMDIAAFDDEQKAMLKQHQDEILCEDNLIEIDFVQEYRSLLKETCY